MLVHILLTLLKIIGIILLVILGILVLLVGVVLFVPIRYHGTASASGNLDSLKAHIKFSWLLHVMSGYAIYENKKTDWRIRFLWKKYGPEEESAEKEEDGEAEIEETQVDEKASEEIEEDKPVEKQTKEEKLSEGECQKEKSEEKTKEKKLKVDKAKEKTNIYQKIKYTFTNICDRIKSLLEAKETLEDFIKDEKHQAAWKRLKKETVRLLRFLTPKKFIMNLRLGFEDPSVTGKVLAGASILYPFYGEYVNITPDFERSVLEGDAYIKGTIKGVHLLIVIWNLVFDENIRMTYADIKKLENKKNRRKKDGN